MRRLRSVTLVGWTFLLLAGASEAAAQPQQQTVQFSFNITKAGQPVANVQVAQVRNNVATPVATSNSSGTAIGVLNLGNVTKARMEVWEYECPDGTKLVYVLSPGERPPEDRNCPKKKRIAVVVVVAGQHLTATIEVAEGAEAFTQTGGPPVAGLPTGVPSLISIELGGAVGLKNLGGTSGQGAAFMQAVPGGTFNTSANTVAGEVIAEMDVGRFFEIGASAWRAMANTSNGSGQVLGGATDTAHVEQLFQGFSLTAGPKIPLGGNACVSAFAGGNFWHDHIDTRDTVASGTTTSTATSSRGVDGRNWTAGAAVEVHVSSRWTVFVVWNYLPMENAGVNVHLNNAAFGVKFRVIGSRAK